MKSMNPLWDTNIGIIVRKSNKDGSRLFLLTALALFNLEYPEIVPDFMLSGYLMLVSWVLFIDKKRVVYFLSYKGSYLSFSTIIKLYIFGWLINDLFGRFNF